MNTKFLISSILITSVAVANAQINVQGDGSDGVLNVTSSRTIDLRLARQAAWNDSNIGNNGNGIYDASKRAIVFKYSSVNISSGATLTFTNHPSRCPVVWLVSGAGTNDGNVTITGTLNLNGTYSDNQYFSEPGAGGFRGGPNNWKGAGLGIGGGSGDANYSATHTSYPYGNPTCIPLIGGSGGRGSFYSGGGGGGAILIACAKTLAINGTIGANGAQPYSTGAGSAGAVRLVANSITGSGGISTLPDGRIRLESNTISGSIYSTPQTVPVIPSNPVKLWPSDDAPTAQIISVDNGGTPLDPIAGMDTSADVNISKLVTLDTVVKIRTRNFPTDGTVKLRVASKYSGTASLLTAAPDPTANNSLTEATWVVTFKFAEGYSCLQAIATKQ